MRFTREEKDNLRQIDTNKKDLNVIKWGSNENYEHFLGKCKLCYYFKKNHSKFICEAILTKGRGRVDVFNLTNSVAYEVICTEKEESINIKKDKYGLMLVSIKSDDILNASEEDIANMI